MNKKETMKHGTGEPAAKAAGDVPEKTGAQLTESSAAKEVKPSGPGEEPKTLTKGAEKTPEVKAEDERVKKDSESKAESEEAKKARKKRKRQIREIKSFFLRLVAMIIMLYVLFGVVFGVRAMPNDDMKPRISAGDLLLYYRLENRYVANDVVVFEKDGKTYTGRIIAQGGDTVEITDNASLVVNNSSVVENDIYYSTPKYDTDVTYPLTLASDEYFILCDYRTGAKDSRAFGAVKRSEFKGKVITVLRRSGL